MIRTCIYIPHHIMLFGYSALGLLQMYIPLGLFRVGREGDVGISFPCIPGRYSHQVLTSWNTEFSVEEVMYGCN